MNLYFSPLACSLATRIALYEAEAQAQFTQVDTRSKRVADGTDFLEGGNDLLFAVDRNLLPDAAATACHLGEIGRAHV